MYFLISNSEDSLHAYQFQSSDDLKDYLEEYYSDYPVKFFDRIPRNFDDLDSIGLYVIKGEMIIPTPVTIVKTFEVE